ncbi:hypothetical protein BLNAU_18761 [Blattamonas nauphoetae]|uniref:Uncharacterized protein n=1 Tax=Blattamonas nauphoetae TaxID=2049346 RepID=A0ABQ9X3H1_9EUKA|nr:hypothetical protein BLNAU_18761 [Blattamonas nauphoetae]
MEQDETSSDGDLSDLPVEDILQIPQFLDYCRELDQSILPIIEKKEFLDQLVSFSVRAPTQTDDLYRYMIPYVASQIFLTPSEKMLNIISDIELVMPVLSFMKDNSHIDPVFATNFRCILQCFIKSDVTENVKSFCENDGIQLLVKHISSFPICELTIDILNAMFSLNTNETLAEWIKDCGIIPLLLVQLEQDENITTPGNVAFIINSITGLFSQTHPSLLLDETESNTPLYSEDSLKKIVDFALDNQYERSSIGWTRSIQCVSILIDLVWNTRRETAETVMTGFFLASGKKYSTSDVNNCPLFLEVSILPYVPQFTAKLLVPPTNLSSTARCTLYELKVVVFLSSLIRSGFPVDGAFLTPQSSFDETESTPLTNLVDYFFKQTTSSIFLSELYTLFETILLSSNPTYRKNVPDSSPCPPSLIRPSLKSSLLLDSRLPMKIVDFYRNNKSQPHFITLNPYCIHFVQLIEDISSTLHDTFNANAVTNHFDTLRPTNTLPVLLSQMLSELDGWEEYIHGVVEIEVAKETMLQSERRSPPVVQEYRDVEETALLRHRMKNFTENKQFLIDPFAMSTNSENEHQIFEEIATNHSNFMKSFSLS